MEWRPGWFTPQLTSNDSISVILLSLLMTSWLCLVISLKTKISADTLLWDWNGRVWPQVTLFAEGAVKAQTALWIKVPKTEDSAPTIVSEAGIRT